MAKALTAHDVFTPSSFPEHTYVVRGEDDLEDKLRFALKTKGQIVSLSGPSKSGKTVLVEKVVGKENLIPVVGAGIRDAEQVWTRVLDWLDAPVEVNQAKSWQLATGATAMARAQGNILVAEGQAGGDLQTRFTRRSVAGERKNRRGLEQVIDDLAGTELVVLVDDFHYMSREVQVEVAKQLKEAARREVKVVTASVPHRADDVVRANPELRGRVALIDVAYWRPRDLVQIAISGFAALNVDIDQGSAERLAQQAAGSPQLMQALCLYACFVLGTIDRMPKRVSESIKPEDHVKLCRLTSTVTDFRSLVDALEAGPRARQGERRTYRFVDGTEGDVYRAILKAISDDPLALTFDYEEILRRVKAVCDGESPVGSAVTGACAHMARLAEEQLPAARPITWDESSQVLEIPDPYLSFYLRWSDRLRST
ncbi:MAG: hypothetical protein JST00_33240 [Deltaproteobacteria bacterium]|nr:hypothetical protein [Deltaproteobacteria bacterium]